MLNRMEHRARKKASELHMPVVFPGHLNVWRELEDVISSWSSSVLAKMIDN